MLGTMKQNDQCLLDFDEYTLKACSTDRNSRHAQGPMRELFEKDHGGIFPGVCKDMPKALATFAEIRLMDYELQNV